ncbi:hypothetical protein FRC09_007274 [Ceratobasidium sp. 395]|nr:hypothetical protein FRC09_007274 [Ceratobasidium sp. 395]
MEPNSTTFYVDATAIFQYLSQNPARDSQARHSSRADPHYYPYQETEIRDFLKRLLVSTESVEDNFRQAAGAIIMRITYGYRVKTIDDKLVVLAATTNADVMRAALASNFLVNVIPALKYIPSWMPGAGWKRKAMHWKEKVKIMANEPFEWTKRNVREGTAEPSVVQTLLADIPESGMEVEDAEDHIKYLAATMFPGKRKTFDNLASQQTVASFMIFVLAMTLFPEVQQKAQAEIEQVIGSDRLPNLQDQESLPYINAIIQEVIRWQPVAQMGMPHRTTQDDIYRGYLIPKGTTVLGNVWAVTRDPDVYPDPETFNPDRYYNQPAPPAPGFGWGRRICPGQHIVEGTLFVAIASLLAAFTISKARDENGEEIVPTASAKENSMV